MMTTIRISQSGEIVFPDNGSNVICAFEPDDPRLKIKRYRIIGFSIRDPDLHSKKISISSVEEFLQIVRSAAINIDQIPSLLNFQRNYLELPMMIASHGETVIFFELCDTGDYSHEDILEYFSRYNLIHTMSVSSDTNVSEEILTEETFVNKLKRYDITTANVDSLLEFQRERSRLPFMLASNGKIVVLFQRHMHGKYSIEDVLDYDDFPDKIEPHISEFKGVTVTSEFDPNDPLLKVRRYAVVTCISLSTSDEDCDRIVLNTFHRLVKSRQVNAENVDALLKFQRRFLGLPIMISVYKQHVTYFERHPVGGYSHEDILEQSTFQPIRQYRRGEEFELVSKPYSYEFDDIAYFQYCMLTKNIYVENVHRLQELQKWFIDRRLPNRWFFATNGKQVVMFEHCYSGGDYSHEDIRDYSDFTDESYNGLVNIQKSFTHSHITHVRVRETLLQKKCYRICAKVKIIENDKDVENRMACFNECLKTQTITTGKVKHLLQIQTTDPYKFFPRMLAADEKWAVLFEFHLGGDLSYEDILNYSDFPVEPSSLIQLQIEKQKILIQLANCIRESCKKSGTIPSSEVGKPYTDRLDQLDQQIEQAIAADPVLSALQKRRKDCLLKLCDRVRKFEDFETLSLAEVKSYFDELTTIESELQVVREQLSTPPEITFVPTSKVK